MSEIMSREQYEKWAEEERERRREKLRKAPNGMRITFGEILDYEGYLKKQKEEAQFKKEIEIRNRAREEVFSKFTEADINEWAYAHQKNTETVMSKKIDKLLTEAKQRARKQINNERKKKSLPPISY
jgi:uncharacterized protein YkwD